MTIERINGQYVINRNDGTSVSLTCNEASLLINFCGKEGLRQQIEYRLDEANGDWIDISKYEGTREEFIDEIYEAFEDEIDYGNSVDDDDIDDKIADYATSYDMLLE